MSVLPRFALFEFEDDNSIDIGETLWICDIAEAITSIEEFDTEATVEVMWPSNSSAIIKHREGKKLKPIPKDTKCYEAKVLLFSGKCNIKYLTISRLTIMINRVFDKIL